MYFIVYIIENNDKSNNKHAYAILPQNWIKDIDEHLEKFLNRSLNKNQVFTCYWTTAKECTDRNGDIRLDFQPNFSASFGNIFPSDGCYLCKLIRAKNHFIEAIEDLMKIRGPPAIYNPLRLFEIPIPKIKACHQSPDRPGNHSNSQPSSQPSTRSSMNPTLDPTMSSSSKLRSAKLKPAPTATATVTSLQTSSGTSSATSTFVRATTDPSSLTSSSHLSTSQSTSRLTTMGKTVPPTDGLAHSSLAEAYGLLKKIHSQPIPRIDVCKRSRNHLRNRSFLGSTKSQAVSSSLGSSSKLQSATSKLATVAAAAAAASTTVTSLQSTRQNNSGTSLETSSNQIVRGTEDPRLTTMDKTASKTNDWSGNPNRIPSMAQSEIKAETSAAISECVPVYGFYDSNVEEISSALNVSSVQNTEQNHVYTYDEVEMSFLKFPIPFKATDKDLVKRQNDIISGNLPFNENKNGRVYQVGERMFEIARHVIQQFIQWNTNPIHRINIEIDKRYVRALLLVMMTKEDLMYSKYKPEVIEFIRLLLVCRTNNSERVDALSSFIEEFRLEISKNSNKD